MFKYDKLDQQKYSQKSYTGYATCLSINTIESINSIDAHDGPNDESYSEKPLGHYSNVSIDNNFLMSETSYPDSQQRSYYVHSKPE
jgi:hypothetical protein